MKWFTTPRRSSSSITDPEPLLIKIGPLTNQSDKKQQNDDEDKDKDKSITTPGKLI